MGEAAKSGLTNQGSGGTLVCYAVSLVDKPLRRDRGSPLTGDRPGYNVAQAVVDIGELAKLGIVDNETDRPEVVHVERKDLLHQFVALRFIRFTEDLIA